MKIETFVGNEPRPTRLRSALRAPLRFAQKELNSINLLLVDRDVLSVFGQFITIFFFISSSSFVLHVQDDIDADEAVKLVRGATNKNCELDPVPTWIIKEFVGDLAPFIAYLINASFPSDQKCAMVTPILKKISLDPWDLSNYRPVSNLSFISKILERSVYTPHNGYLHAHNLFPAKQSAYRKFHSTETALIDILCDVHSAVDACQLMLLALLDQSAAFDVIDHQILLERLQHYFGLSGKVLEWIRSNLRSFYVKFNGISSSISSLICGVQLPQGSVLGPPLFIL